MLHLYKLHRCINVESLNLQSESRGRAVSAIFSVTFGLMCWYKETNSITIYSHILIFILIRQYRQVYETAKTNKYNIER